MIEEESTGIGALSTVQRGYRADAASFPSRSAATRAAQVGVIWFRLKVRGQPVHVFEAGTGANAIKAAYHLMCAGKARGGLERARKERPPLQVGERIRSTSIPASSGRRLGLQRAGLVRPRLPARGAARLVGQDCQKEILACVYAAARDHRFLANNPPVVEWSGFLSEGYELTDSAEPEAAFGKAYDAVYGGEVPEACLHRDDRHPFLRA